jgi:hypothetical protein
MVETEPAAIGPHAGGLEPILRVRDSKQLFSPVNGICSAWHTDAWEESSSLNAGCTSDGKSGTP